MRMKSILWIAVLFVSLWPADAWSAQRHGDIHLESGEVLENVDFEVQTRFKAITVETASGKRSFSFLDIAGILEDGKDVTEKLIGRYSTIDAVEAVEPEPEIPETIVPETETQEPAVPASSLDEPVEPTPERTQAQREGWLSKEDPEYKKAHGAIFKGLLEVSGLYSAPIGDYFEGITGGIGFDATGVIPFNHNVSLRLSVAKLGQQWDDDYFLISLDPNFSFGAQSIDFSSWRYSAAIQAYKHFDEDRGNASMYYFYTGLGAWRGTMDVEVALLSGGTPVETVKTSETQTKFLLNYGAGMLRMISDNVGVDVSVEFDLLIIGSNESNQSYDPYMNVSYAGNFDLQLGLVVLFQ